MKLTLNGLILKVTCFCNIWAPPTNKSTGKKNDGNFLFRFTLLTKANTTNHKRINNTKHKIQDTLVLFNKQINCKLFSILILYSIQLNNNKSNCLSWQCKVRKDTEMFPNDIICI